MTRDFRACIGAGNVMRLKSYLADTFALVVFSTLGGAMIEVLIVGLTLYQTFWVRLAAIPIMLAAGRPYGIFRDLIFRLLRVPSERALHAALADTISNVAFQVPVYAALLLLNGVTITQAIYAVSSVIVFIEISGRPFGMFLEWSRTLFGVRRSPFDA